jgi:hypothetical protein
MIFGNPDKFAIEYRYVPEWSDPPGGFFHLGLFYFYLNGKIFPSREIVSTLGVDIDWLNGNALKNFVDNESFFRMDKNEAFKDLLYMYRPLYLTSLEDLPDDFVEDESYVAATPNLTDDCCHVFAVGYKESVRIIGAKTAELVPVSADRNGWVHYDSYDVYEVVLAKTDVLEIVEKVIAYDRAIYNERKRLAALQKR